MMGRDAILFGTPSGAQDPARNSILHCIRMLAPFEEAIPDNGISSTDMAEGERQFYAFMKQLYEAMYSDPAFFLLPEDSWSEARFSASKNKGSENGELLLEQAISFYASYLYELGVRCEGVEQGALLLRKEAWKEAAAAVDVFSGQGEKQRLARLSALGLERIESKDTVFLHSDEFPKMFFGLMALCQHGEEAYRRGNFLRLDYRSAVNGKPDIVSVVRSLPPQTAAMVETLNCALVSRGLVLHVPPMDAITSGFWWNLEYFYEEARVLTVEADSVRLLCSLGLGPRPGVEKMKAALIEMDSRAAGWLEKNIVSGEVSFLKVENPSPEELSYLLGALELLRPETHLK